MKNWVISGDILEIADNGTRILANADQVYASIIDQNPVWNDLLPGKIGDAASLTFSRYPVDMAVVLSAEPDKNQPRLTFEAQTQSGRQFPLTWKAVQLGHVVHKGTWYRSFAGATDAIVALLEKAGMDASDSKSHTLRGYLELKKIAIEDELVIDRLSVDTLRQLPFQHTSGSRPKSIEATLYPYQIQGWHWLRYVIQNQLGGLLADEMGLGKTLQIISAISDTSDEKSAAGALVIAPGSLLENWIREIMKFCPQLKALKHHGTMRTGTPIDLKEFDVVITSYETVSRDLSLLKMIEWNVVILDEAQQIRNPQARRTKAVKEMKRKVSLAVTGTPVENRLIDLWSIMDFVVPGYLGNLKAFENQYTEDLRMAATLEPLVSPLMLRRKVADVAEDLPDRIDIPEILELSEEEAMAYEDVRKDILEQYGPSAALVSLTKLRQFCAHPVILDQDVSYWEHLKFSKYVRLKELLTEIFSRHEKALVFTSYTAMADLIKGIALDDSNVMAAILDGRLNIEERQPLIDRFTDHKGPAVLVLNPRAGGAGLNITAANHVIHYNPEWNPALEDQASARAYRRGQERPVTVRRLIFSGTVEEVMDERLSRKRELTDAAIVGVEGKEEDYADIVAALERSPFSER